MSDSPTGGISAPTPTPTPAQATAAPVYSMREIDVTGGQPIELRSDLAVPPGCTIQGS